MKKLSILVLLILSGCVPTDFQLQLVNSPYEHSLVEEAIADFNDEWYTTFNVDIMEYTFDTEIEFFTIKSDDWYDYKKMVVRGETVDWNSIRIGLPDEEFIEYLEEYQEFENGFPIDQTALFHELVHMSLWNTTKPATPDPNHSEGDGPWTAEHDKMIDRLKENWKEKYPYLTGEEVIIENRMRNR